ncbi:helix-turn-helix transcriptional regulator [Streptomyces actinomycinicus]|nr:helix-turn-helix transcriptional regulator [Streptomyces actinomycinicus]
MDIDATEAGPGHPWDESRTGSRPGKDEIVRSLLKVSSLIQDTAALHRGGEVKRSWTTPVAPDETSVVEAVAQLVRRARQSVDICFAEHTPRSRRFIEALRARKATVRVRITHSGPGRAGTREFWERVAGSDHIEVRTARVPLIDCVVVDCRSALLIADSPLGPQVSLTRAGGVVGALHALFLAVWRGATPVRARIDWGGRARAELAERVLRCLHSGMTDAQAADELSVSTRTYQCYVAEVMAALGATSRFQAGLRAAELGLLPTATPPTAPLETPSTAPPAAPLETPPTAPPATPLETPPTAPPAAPPED